MDFALTEEQLELQEMVRDFVAKEITPYAAEMDRENHAREGLMEKAADMLFTKNSAKAAQVLLLLSLQTLLRPIRFCWPVPKNRNRHTATFLTKASWRPLH